MNKCDLMFILYTLCIHCSSASPWNCFFQSLRSKASKSLYREIDREWKKKKITFNWISPAFTGHFVQQSSLCSLCLGDKAHYIIVVHCVLTVGPLPGCWEWISWAHCPYSKAWLFKVKRPDLITHTTYVDYGFLCSITLHIINPPLWSESSTAEHSSISMTKEGNAKKRAMDMKDSRYFSFVISYPLRR